MTCGTKEKEKIMIEKKIFVQMMKAIKAINEDFESLENILNCGITRGNLYQNFEQFYNAVISIFSVYDARGDVEDDFDFFCWETNFGEKFEMTKGCFSIYNKVFEVKSIEDFYDYLLERYVNEDKEKPELQFTPIG